MNTLRPTKSHGSVPVRGKIFFFSPKHPNSLYSLQSSSVRRAQGGGGGVFHWDTASAVGTAVLQWLRCCATNRNVAGSIPAGVIGIFHWHKILPIALWPWGRLSLYQKWVPGAFPGGTGGRCVSLTTLPPSCAVVMKYGNLNFLEPSGPLQASNGTALHFTASAVSY